MLTAERRERKTKISVRNPQGVRASILRAATSLFAAKGPDAARVDEIAARAGVNKRMLYHYFGDKQGLYLSVLSETYNRIGQLSAEAMNNARDVRELLDAILQGYFRFLQQNPEFIALLNWENSRCAEGLRSVALSGSDRPSSLAQSYMAALHRALDKEQKNFTIHEDVDIKYLIMACLGLCSYYFTNRYTLSVVFDMDLENPAAMEQWLEHVRRLVLDGIFTKKDSPREVHPGAVREPSFFKN